MGKILQKVLSAVLITAMVVGICPSVQLVKGEVDYGTNIAKGKNTESSGMWSQWWMYDDAGNLKPDSLKAYQSANAVDGDEKTSYFSAEKDDQWMYVDLGREYTIGRVRLNWSYVAGKVYDIQVSNDAKNWKTVFRQTKGVPNRTEDIQAYAEKVRYVRLYVYRRIEGMWVLSELEVYEYKSGDEKVVRDIGTLPKASMVNVGKGTYLKDDIYHEYSKPTTYIDEDNITGPVESNGWWTSAVINQFSNLLCISPLKAKYSDKGLGVLTGTSGWVGSRGENDLSTSQESETGIDFYIEPGDYDSKSGYDKVHNYSDYSVDIGLWDGNGIRMKSTFTQGIPYIFSSMENNTTAYINSSTIKEIFDGSGKSILSSQGETITTDHIGFKSFDNENTKAGNEGAYYCISVPEGTVFKTITTGSNYKIQITFPSKTKNYMSIATMPAKGDIDTYYKHGYAFVTDTSVDYSFNESNSKVLTEYNVTTKSMRDGFSDQTMQCLFPHQWKKSTDANSSAASYMNMRGIMKGIWKNKFSTTQQFSGLLPTFATPQSSAFSADECRQYLKDLEEKLCNASPQSDAYWEGKNVHPLAMGILMADQLGEVELKEKYIKKLKIIFDDWFNYDGDGDACYFLYNKEWGTIYYQNSQYGANGGISDHNFTYGYFVFGAVILATYDNQFLNDYKDMVELMLRDYSNPLEPEDDGNMFCKFRSFDPYAGHSWAGGYADGDSGNNQESSSEALFSWEAMYLWGELTNNKLYKDAGAYGFTTELEAVQQYWFDYDEDNWHKDYPFKTVGILYAGSAGFTTYFGGQPIYVYGIQWLPISEYLTYHGMNQSRCAKIYAGLESDTQRAIDIAKRTGGDANGYKRADNEWQHIAWPYLSQTNPSLAISKFKSNSASVQKEDRADTLWFISAMDQLGYRTNDYIVTGDITGSVYYNKNTGKYTVQVWNPTDGMQTVTVVNAQGKKAGTAQVGARGLVSFNIDTTKEFSIKQVSTPTIKATSLEDQTVKDNITGTVSFEDSQTVELACGESGATIYYTIDGTNPTTKSPVYKDKISVTKDTVIKAIAVKSGCMDSAYASAQFTMVGNSPSKNINLALKKTVTASSYQGTNTPEQSVDGNVGTRWESKATDNEYLQVDLGEIIPINAVKISWEAAYAEQYKIMVSDDGNSWKEVATEKGISGIVNTTFDVVKARYVKMLGVKRATTWSYSIYEFQVYEANKAKSPKMTPKSGKYDTAQIVNMSTSLDEAEIRYTLDGSKPTESSQKYTGPFTVTKSTIIKAVTYKNGIIPSDVVQTSIVINGDENICQEPEEVVAKCSANNTIQVQWSTNSNGQKYNVYIDNVLKAENLDAGTYTYNQIPAGSHTIKVTSKLNGIESAGVLVNIFVKDNTTTTKQDTTTKSQVITTKTLVTTTKVPTATTKTSAVTTKAPAGTTKGTDVTTKVQNTTTKNPGVTTEIPSASEKNTTVQEIPTTKSQETPIASPQVTTRQMETTQTHGNKDIYTTNSNQNKSEGDTTKHVAVGNAKVKKASKKPIGKVSILLKKVSGASGYQIRIASDKKGKKVLMSKKVKKLKMGISKKKIKKKVKMYISVRAYKVINKVMYFGNWSKYKKVKVLK